MPGQSKIYLPLLAAASSGLYYILLFFTPRENFLQVISLFGGLFILYLLLVRFSQNLRVHFIFILALIFHIIPLLSPQTLPALSDDFYRFIWDGRLLTQGVNPFAMIPEEYMKNPEHALQLGLTPELYQGLNSKTYFTIYPPVLQGVFYMAAFISPDSIPGSVWVMKMVILLAEIGSIGLMIKLLRHFELPVPLVSWYAFNPLVIVELTGNLHFEVLMIFFLLWALWWFVQGKWQLSSVPFALAVGSKLLPLMFLPLLIRRIGWVKTFVYGALVVTITVFLFVPVFDQETFRNLYQSIDLYFHKFEFNASIYYLVRWVGYQQVGYNVIQTVGKYLAMAVVIAIGVYSFFEKNPDDKNLPAGWLWVLIFYFSLASIVHPWYVTSLVAFSIFTHYRFAIVWSFFVLLSYFTYQTTAYHENLWLTALEYFILGGWIIFELKNQTGDKPVKSPNQTF
ncbi:MAG: hypothetical protein SF052_17425 [Bacteroidia bacterium]|nr:hypothetical protein [Bacteroidia bacterium]